MPKIPAHLADIDKWETNRRRFIKGAIASSLLIQFPVLSGCEDENLVDNGILSANEAPRLKLLLETLWPNDGNGPSVTDLNTFNYITNFVMGTSANPDHNSFIKEGIEWFHMRSIEKFKVNLENLSKTEVETIVELATGEEYGETWCSAIITHIFESLVLDPIYGVQKNQAGWTWLDHTPGYPRPNENNRFENFQKIVHGEV